MFFFINCLMLFPDVVNIFLLGLAAVLMHSKMLRTPSCGFGSLCGLGKPSPTVHEWSMNPQTSRPWDGHVFDCLSAWQRQTGTPFLLSLCLNVTYCKLFRTSQVQVLQKPGYKLRFAIWGQCLSKRQSNHFNKPYRSLPRVLSFDKTDVFLD